MKRIAILTSGGDAPGMNACIRSVVKTAIGSGMEVMGVLRGYKGLIEDEFIALSHKEVSGIMQRGGTVLYTSRCPEFVSKEGQKRALENLKKYEIEGLVVLGGDGSYAGAIALAKAGVNVVAIPATIDNDLYYTDHTLGFDTAVNTITSLINNIRDTASSHERPSVIEVMGAYCGDIALNVGAGVGAEIILVPEVKVTDKQIVDAVEKCETIGKSSCMIITNEKVYDASKLSDLINKRTGVASRPLEVGHIQRGGSPSAFDRVLALKFGACAVKMLVDGKSGAVGDKNGDIIAVELSAALKGSRQFDYNLYQLALKSAGDVLKLQKP